MAKKSKGLGSARKLMKRRKAFKLARRAILKKNLILWLALPRPKA